MADTYSDTYFLTTPIYYVTATPHLGHAYTTIVGDALARWHRLLGDDVHFLTGTDEHGQKVQDAAEAAGQTPQDFVDAIAPLYQQAWTELDISNDDFIRTTEARHKVGVAELLQRCYDAGDIELDVYAGKYCVACEEYYTDDELIDGDLCPIHKRAGRVLRGGELLLPPQPLPGPPARLVRRRTPRPSSPSSAATRHSG